MHKPSDHVHTCIHTYILQSIVQERDALRQNLEEMRQNLTAMADNMSIERGRCMYVCLCVWVCYLYHTSVYGYVMYITRLCINTILCIHKNISSIYMCDLAIYMRMYAYMYI